MQVSESTSSSGSKLAISEIKASNSASVLPTLTGLLQSQNQEPFTMRCLHFLRFSVSSSLGFDCLVHIDSIIVLGGFLLLYSGCSRLGSEKLCFSDRGSSVRFLDSFKFPIWVSLLSAGYLIALGLICSVASFRSYMAIVRFHCPFAGLSGCHDGGGNGLTKTSLITHLRDRHCNGDAQATTKHALLTDLVSYHGPILCHHPDLGDRFCSFCTLDHDKAPVPFSYSSLDLVDGLLHDQHDGFTLHLLDSLFSKGLRTVKSIPPKCRLGFSRVLKGALDKVICKPDDISCWVSLLVLPLCLLKTFCPRSNLECKSANKRQCQEESITNAIRSWGVPGGSWQLVRETLTESASPMLDLDEENLDLKFLSSSGVAPYNDATLQELKAKHPFKSAPSLPDIPIDHHQLIASQDVVLDRIKSFPRGTSCGRDGLRAQHLMDCLSGAAVAISDELVSSITQVVNLFLEGKCPMMLGEYIASAPLTPLVKPGGGIRPIAVGGEAIIHAVNRLVEDRGDDVGLSMLLVDFQNAFNLGVYLDDGPYCWGYCWLLGVPLFSVSKPCSVCSKVFTGDVYGDHVVSCAGVIGIKHRHNAEEGLMVCVDLTGSTADQEKQLGRLISCLVGDMLLYSWDEGLDVCVDLTGSSPLTQIGMADFVPDLAVIDAAQRKRDTYMANCAAIGYEFLPFSFSSLGDQRQTRNNVSVGAVKNSLGAVLKSRKVNPNITDESYPVIVLDDSCLMEHDFSCGLWVLIDMDSIASKEKINNHVGVGSWFNELKLGCNSFVSDDRIALETWSPKFIAKKEDDSSSDDEPEGDHEENKSGNNGNDFELDNQNEYDHASESSCMHTNDLVYGFTPDVVEENVVENNSEKIPQPKTTMFDNNERVSIHKSGCNHGLKFKVGGSILEVIDELIKMNFLSLNIQGLGNKAKKGWIQERCGGISLLIMLLVPPLVTLVKLTERKMLWDYMHHLIDSWDGEFVLLGDFNEVRLE
ncbi:hypothetical protein Tco_0662147 [Tanacetum coccineum]